MFDMTSLSAFVFFLSFCPPLLDIVKDACQPGEHSEINVSKFQRRVNERSETNRVGGYVIKTLSHAE